MRQIIFILFLILFSCKSETKTVLKNKNENTTLSTESTNSKQSKQRLRAYCFFKLDDKYATENDTIAIQNWLKEKSLAILKGDAIESIFSQNGGGPNGSQWNPSTDLYVAISTPLKEFREAPKLFVNGKLYQEQSYVHSPTLTWYSLSLDFWEREVKEIDAAAIKKIYDSDVIKDITEMGYDPLDMLKDGEIILFEISYGEDILTNFFHATYGE